jgi:uncharacterized protein (DUF983 family)
MAPIPRSISKLHESSRSRIKVGNFKAPLCPLCYDGSLFFSNVIKRLVCNRCRQDIYIFNDKKEVIDFAFLL